MRKLFLIAFVLCAFQIQAQLVQGGLKIKEQSKVELEIKGNKAVNLYAAFRENNYPIHFIFTGIDIPVNSDKKEVVQFVFTTTVKKDGKSIDAVAQVTKQGYIFVFDRVSGQPLFPIEEIPAPASALDGEIAWATQPVPISPAPYARQAYTLTAHDISPFAEKRTAFFRGISEVKDLCV